MYDSNGALNCQYFHHGIYKLMLSALIADLGQVFLLSLEVTIGLRFTTDKHLFHIISIFLFRL